MYMVPYQIGMHCPSWSLNHTRFIAPELILIPVLFPPPDHLSHDVCVGGVVVVIHVVVAVIVVAVLASPARLGGALTVAHASEHNLLLRHPRPDFHIILSDQNEAGDWY